MKQLHASKIADGITEIQFKDHVTNPFIKVVYFYPDSGVDGQLSFKHSDRGHNDLQRERQNITSSITHLLGLSGEWSLVKLTFDWSEFLMKADLERFVDGYAKPMKLKTPTMNDLVLDEVTPLFAEASEYVTGEKRQQAEMFSNV